MVDSCNLKDKLFAHVKKIEDFFNARFNHNIIGTPEQKGLATIAEARMREHIKDERILKGVFHYHSFRESSSPSKIGILPGFPVNCRRMTPGDPYMAAIQQKNVDVHFTGVARITAEGVIGDDGIERKCDTIVCATGEITG
jgi:hypothetical protein